MATSPNYAWAEPDNSSLVKNGAADIRTLGDAIDTSVWNVGYGQASKNKLINADFGINQRNASTTSTTNEFIFDRWKWSVISGTNSYSAQTFTSGAAPEAGYESKNFARMVTSGQTGTTARANWAYLIEDVRNFAGQTVTISYWAKAASGTPKLAIELQQNFGGGGSPSATVLNYVGQTTLTTSWARYSLTYALPSISGKTFGTDGQSYLGVAIFTSAGTDFNARTGSLGIQSNTFDLWGVQLEYGSKATPFQTASGGSPQNELAMCQRYYYRIQNDSTNAYTNITGIAYSTTGIAAFVPLKTTMRATPTAVDFASLRSFDATNSATITAITLSAASPNVAAIDVTASSLTQYRPYVILGNTVPSFIGFSAEL
jgi:hypothetical protein